MPYSIKTSQCCEDIIEWLQENVGSLQWSRPIIEWKGVNWSMHAHGVTDDESRMNFIVRLDEERHAMLFALRWS